MEIRKPLPRLRRQVRRSSSREQFQRLGVMGEFDNPYITMAPHTRPTCWRCFARLVEQGWSTSSSSPCTGPSRTAPPWPTRNWNTTTARTPASTCLRADRRRRPASCRRTSAASRRCLMIWTTTPWTLPANLAVAVHPDFEYAVVRCTTADGADDARHRRRSASRPCWRPSRPSGRAG